MTYSMKRFSLFAGSIAFLSTLACAATINVDMGKEYQRISGFGAASAWAGSITDKNAAFLWDSTSGAGLTLHRIRIAPDGSTSETSIAKKASEYGVKVWAAPWTSKYTVNYDGDRKTCEKLESTYMLFRRKMSPTAPATTTTNPKNWPVGLATILAPLSIPRASKS